MPKELVNYAVAIIVETPDGIPLVSDPEKPSPHFWKFPGGRNRAREMPPETAVRELKEETGITMPAHSLTLTHWEERTSAGKNHQFFLFHGKTNKSVKLCERGEGGELVKFFTLEKIKTMPDFFPNHRPLINKVFP